MQTPNHLFLILPHQLFEGIEPLRSKKVLLIEEPLFFTQYRFHIQKLVLHRASMKFYEDYLKAQGIEVEYCEDASYLESYREHSMYMYDVTDDWLSKKLHQHFKNLTTLPNPNFLNVQDSNRFLHHYYINRRKELGIFMDNGKPYGGKWSFDSDNRKKLPKEIPIPPELVFENSHIEEAKTYCQRFDTVGSCENFYYPSTFEEAKINFHHFLRTKFQHFGDYQDAIDRRNPYLFHANISSSLNNGLLDLQYVIEQIIKQDVPFNAKEGFIRQIIGWREFMLTVYKSSHVLLRTSNFFGFTRKIPSQLLLGKSGLTPLDDAISKLHETGYNHHIERLMILGNLFLLLEIDPDEVYTFFMAHYIDAYDWVMVGNVYGMSGFSDGGSLVTKPYISSSNYILKMSRDYKKSDAWCKLWDGLYWRFLDKYHQLFANNLRMKMQLALLEKMEERKLREHIRVAEGFIAGLR